MLQLIKTAVNEKSINKNLMAANDVKFLQKCC